MNTPDLSRFRFGKRLSKTAERRLVRLAARGDQNALTEVHDRFQLLVVKHCNRLAGGWMHGSDAEDILSEANVGLVEAIRTFRGGRARFSTWLFLYVRRHVLDYLHARTRLAGPDKKGTTAIDHNVPPGGLPIEASWLSSTETGSGPDETASRDDYAARARGIIATWSSDDQALFRHRVEDDWTFDQLAQFLSTPELRAGGRRTAAPHFHRLLARLRDAIRERIQ